MSQPSFLYQNSCELRVTAVLDLLGFKQIIKGIKAPEEPNYSGVNSLIELLVNIRNTQSVYEFSEAPGEHPNSYHPIIKPDYISSSDHIIISAPARKTDIERWNILPPWFLAFIGVAHYASHLQTEILKLGIATRGAIAIGEEYIDLSKEMIIGNGSIDAHEAEKYLAHYPRIIATPSLVNKFIEREKELYSTCPDYKPNSLEMRPHLRRDFDGSYHIDFLHLNFMKASDVNSLTLLNEIKNQIKINLLKKHDERVNQKWYWLANYFDLTTKFWKNQKPSLFQDLEMFNLSPVILF